MDGLYHVISRTARLQVKNDTDGLPVSISTLQCQACLIRPGCSSTLTFNHGDLVLSPDIYFCETRPEPFVASVKLTPSVAAVFNTLPPASADLNVYSFGEARREIVFSVQLELAALPHVKTMTNEDLRTVDQPISHYYTTISSTRRALADYMPMRTAFSLACASMTISLLSFSISFTPLRRQWQRFFKQPQRFFRGTHGRFLHIVPNLNDDDEHAFLLQTPCILTKLMFTHRRHSFNLYVSHSPVFSHRDFFLFRNFGIEAFFWFAFPHRCSFYREP